MLGKIACPKTYGGPCNKFHQLFFAEYCNIIPGPMIFIIIMTFRQAVAILLSCYIYGHHITVIGAFGIFTVFAATFLKIFMGHRQRTKKSALKATQDVTITKKEEPSTV